jgi:hypothetical protein
MAPVVFTRRGRRYEIRPDAVLGFVRCIDGEPIYAASEAHVVARMLIDERVLSHSAAISVGNVGAIVCFFRRVERT